MAGNSLLLSRRHRHRRTLSSSSTSDSSFSSGERRRRSHERRNKRLTSESKRAKTPPPVGSGKNQERFTPPVAEKVQSVSTPVGQSGVTVNYMSHVSGKELPVFDPRLDNVNLWIAKLDSLATLYHWSDLYICQLVANKLHGSAEVWYKSLLVYPRTWLEWKSLLTQTFPPVRDLSSLLKIMMSIKVLPNESLFDYVFRKLAAIRALDLNLSGIDEVNLIAGDIDDENIKFSIVAAGIKTAESLAVYLKPLSMQLNPNVSNSSSSDSKPVKNNITCFHCSQKGHFKSRCPLRPQQSNKINNATADKRKCYSCGERGHLASSCRKGS